MGQTKKTKEKKPKKTKSPEREAANDVKESLRKIREKNAESQMDSDAVV